MNKTLFGLALLGLAFSGYLGGTKLFSGTCAFNESCPYFLGYPACFFGFAMYLVITIAASVLIFGKEQSQELAHNSMLWVSFLGILFAGYFTLGELPLLFTQGLKAYVLGLPTCALGLVMYVAIFVLVLFARKGGKAEEPALG
jgi:uncharacterized membrane protein